VQPWQHGEIAQACPSWNELVAAAGELDPAGRDGLALARTVGQRDARLRTGRIERSSRRRALARDLLGGCLRQLHDDRRRHAVAQRGQDVGGIDPHEQAIDVRPEALRDPQPRAQAYGIGVAAEQRNQNHPYARHCSLLTQALADAVAAGWPDRNDRKSRRGAQVACGSDASSARCRPGVSP
jgi:hypothetical protein